MDINSNNSQFLLQNNFLLHLSDDIMIKNIKKSIKNVVFEEENNVMCSHFNGLTYNISIIVFSFSLKILTNRKSKFNIKYL